MGTPFENIYGQALIVIRDYRLDKLAQTDYASFLLHLQGILINAIPRFSGCLQSLDYDLNAVPPAFINDLSLSEQAILADFMVLVWFMNDTNDITQINLHLQGRDKKTHSESANLKEKTKYLIDLRERVIQRISDYQLEDDSFNKIFGL